MKQRILELLKQCFDAGRYHQMKPFTTDLCGVYCPSFEQWCEDNKSTIATLFDSELVTYKELCEAYRIAYKWAIGEQAGITWEQSVIARRNIPLLETKIKEL